MYLEFFLVRVLETQNGMSVALNFALLAAQTSCHDGAEERATGSRVVIRVCVAKSRFKYAATETLVPITIGMTNTSKSNCLFHLN